MRIQIKRRWSDIVLFEGDFDCLASALAAANLSSADLRGADLRYANLRYANLGGASLRGASLRDTNLSSADLRGANLSSADLGGADLRYANLGGADLRGANLRGANLRGANLGHANLSSADLRGANLSSADLGGADLGDASLRYANLRGASLRGASLRDTNLDHANLSGVNLRNINLTGANLHGAEGLNKYLTTSLYMLLDQPGRIHGYKLVNSLGQGYIHGGITYEIGGYYEQAGTNTDEQVRCGVGLHLATLDWVMREWRDGYRILIAEHFAEDIAAIPIGSDGKYRVHRCQIVGEKDLSELGLGHSGNESTGVE